MMNRKIYIFGALLTLLVLTACQGGKTTAVEELEEEFLASEDEAGSMSLADEDAALAETGRTVARLHHGARKGMKLIQAPEPMMLALQAAALADFGERKRRTAHP